MRYCNRFFLACFSLFALSISLPLSADAQEVLSTVGIAGRDDKLQRSPIVSVRVVPGDTATKLLIDAKQRNDDYTRYPIQFDIYVNRRLLSTQYRSNSLPGPIGIDIGTDVAPPPFNYTIVAKVLTPNGNPFTTVLEAAAFSTALGGLLDCTISVGTGTGSSFVENNVSVEQTGNNSILLDILNADAIGTEDSLDGTLVVTISGDTATGTLSTSVNDLASSQRTDSVTGSVSSSSGGVTSLRLANADGSVSVTCS